MVWVLHLTSALGGEGRNSEGGKSPSPPELLDDQSWPALCYQLQQSLGLTAGCTESPWPEITSEGMERRVTKGHFQDHTADKPGNGE